MGYGVEMRSAKHLVMSSEGTVVVNNYYYELPLEGEFENELEFEGYYSG